MPVEIFDKETFEKALPVKRQASISPMIPAYIETKLWKPLGLVEGEYTYVVPVPLRDSREGQPFGVIIRSSVHADGHSAGTGEDSIRCWISRLGDIRPWGSKFSKYIKRTPGWQERLTVALRALYKMTLLIDKCEHCGEYRKVFKVKKPGPNKGKVFLKCTNCQRDANRIPQFLEI